MSAAHDYLADAQRLSGELLQLRRRLHRCPEPGNREFGTAAIIEDCLGRWGIPFRRMLDTAIVARIDGARPGPCAALRADMDALPLTEATGVGFASENPGMMHACGHDVHMAAALGAARMLLERREALRGSVVLLFQPDEEGDGGAKRMIDAGALEGVDAVFGGHVTPDLPSGSVGVRYGKFYAASDVFKIVVSGRSAHGAEREKGIDALAAAAEMVGALLALPSRLGGECSVVSVGRFHAGSAGNIVADRAELEGIIRTLGPQARARMRQMLAEVVEAVADRYGAGADCRLRESYPGVVNHDDMTALAERAVQALLGADRVRRIEAPTMTTEDFGFFLMERPGNFLHIGAGCPLPLHNPGFLPDDGAVLTAAAVHAAVIEAFLDRG